MCEWNFLSISAAMNDKCLRLGFGLSFSGALATRLEEHQSEGPLTLLALALAVSFVKKLILGRVVSSSSIAPHYPHGGAGLFVFK